MTHLERLAQTEKFRNSKQAERAEMVLWLLRDQDPENNSVSIPGVCGAFEELGFPKPNPTRLRTYFRKSRNVRTISNGLYAPTREFSIFMEDLLPTESTIPDSVFDLDSIELPRFVIAERQADLTKMVRAYARLFLLENSMRGLIETVLSKELGKDWWEKASNSSMKKKHENRIKNEKVKKWAPARSDFGPLYALDWPDLITLMRKYPVFFEPYIKDVNFLHRYDDAGTFRNVVAHNGVLRNDDDFDLIRIYYQNWIKQLS